MHYVEPPVKRIAAPVKTFVGKPAAGPAAGRTGGRTVGRTVVRALVRKIGWTFDRTVTRAMGRTMGRTRAGPATTHAAPAAVMLAVALALALAGGCRSVPAPSEPPATPTGTAERPAIEQRVIPDAREYRLVTGESELHVLVYRGGTLSRLGHNHVVTSRDLSGRVWLAEPLANSAVDVLMPLETLIVDDPAAREQAGEEFPGEIPEKDVTGTRRNMLGDDLLAAESFPFLRIRSAGVRGELKALEIEVLVTLSGRLSRHTFPASVELDDGSLTATGETRITHTALGLDPYSVMLGALAVRDELVLKYRLVAQRVN